MSEFGCGVLAGLALAALWVWGWWYSRTARPPDQPIIPAEVVTLAAGKDDVLIFETDLALTTEQREGLRTHVRTVLNGQPKIMILERGIHLRTLIQSRTAVAE